LQRESLRQSAEEFARYKVDADLKIAEAKAEGSRANEKAVEAQVTLERERQARLKLEQKIKPRSIDDAQESILLENLAAAPKGPILIAPAWMDPEAQQFAKRIEAILVKAGFPVAEFADSEKPLSYGILGAFLVIRDAKKQPSHLQHLYKAFRQAGFELAVHQEEYVPDVNSVVIAISAK
jgi:hypothetical protein